MKLKIYLSLLLFSFLSGMVSQGAEHPKREFRGAWIHTVGQSRYMEMNRDAMQDYFDQMLVVCSISVINAVIFQVRPTAGAFSSSELEPWSKYLTGKQGVAPEPLWDPLQYMIEQCHAATWSCMRGSTLIGWELMPMSRSPHRTSIINTRMVRSVWPTALFRSGVTGVPRLHRPGSRRYCIAIRCRCHSHGRLFLSLSVAGSEFPDENSYAGTVTVWIVAIGVGRMSMH